jgi:hypothetical protein
MQTIDKLAPSRPLPGLPGATIGDFWSWAYSIVLTNTIRAVYAEFLVASALGLTAEPRQDWTSVDFLYREKRIEVKAAGYLQAWSPVEKPSRITFSIAKRIPWDPDTNINGPKPIFSADCFVFCLYTETDRSRADFSVLDTASWRFYVLSTADIEQRFPSQKSLRLATLQAVSTSDGLAFAELAPAIHAALGLTM